MEKKESLDKTKSPYLLNHAVFWPVVIIMGAIIVLSFIDENAFASFVSGVLNAEVISTKWSFGWIILLMSIGAVILCLSKYGDVKIGGADAQPLYKRFSYWSMCICSTIAIGIVFWGVAYPITYYMTPYKNWGVEPGTPEAAVYAIAQTDLEYVFQYCLYMTFGIAMALAIYNYGQPERTSSYLYLLRGKPVSNKISNLVDILCVFGIIGGVTSSLGTGTMQMASGLNILFGVPISKMLWLLVVIAVVAGFVLMSVGGIARGIKIVTDQNLRLYYVVMAAVFLVGPSLYIMDITFEGMGFLSSNLLEMITYTGGVNGDDMPIFWMAWMFVSAAAFAPIVGLFMAKISYGKKIKEMVIGGMLVPSLINIAWFGIFGGTAIKWQEIGKFDVWAIIEESGVESAMWQFLMQFPGGKLWCIVFYIVIILSFVTLASSSTTSAAMSSTTTLRQVSETEEPPFWIKLVWGLIMGASAYIFISYAGINGAKSMALIGGVPTLVLAALATICIFRLPKSDILKFTKQE